MKPGVLTFVSRYLPGYKAGGPVRTIANLVEHLGEELDIRIVTADRDAMDNEPYEGVIADSWTRVGNADVYYASQQTTTLRGITRLMTDTPHDVLYLNSFFDRKFTALPLLARHRATGMKRPVVLAPRGEFSEGAMSLKAWKKLPYVAVARRLGLYRGLIWQASSEHEACDIRRVLGPQATTIRTAPDLPPKADRNGPRQERGRNPADPLRVAFVSRITPKKNLDFALKVLANVQAPVVFSIAGPISDRKYWRRCESIIASLPDRIEVDVVGSLKHSLVSPFIAENDLFFLPTRGENYGHVIAEALSVGTPVLTSTETPWRGLEDAGVGWDLSLDSEPPFVAAIEAAAARRSKEYAAWRQRVVEYAGKRLTDPAIVEANRRLFVEAHAAP